MCSARTSAYSLKPKVMVRPACTARKRSHPGIVGIQDRDAVGRQGFDQFALGQRHALDGIEELHVRVSDVGDHADLRPRDGRQLANLARVIHAHLQHGDAAVIGQAQNRKRNAHMVIEIADRLAHRQCGGEQMRDGILGRSLAGDAGDADDRPAPARPRPARQRLQGRQRIRYRQQGVARHPSARSTTAPTAPASSACFHIGVPVEIRPAQARKTDRPAARCGCPRSSP